MTIASRPWRADQWVYSPDRKIAWKSNQPTTLHSPVRSADRIAELEHELGIAGHEVDCVRCEGLRRVQEGRCHERIGDDVIYTMECPHDL